jgi:hypothetical protein
MMRSTRFAASSTPRRNPVETQFALHDTDNADSVLDAYDRLIYDAIEAAPMNRTD